MEGFERFWAHTSTFLVLQGVGGVQKLVKIDRYYDSRALFVHFLIAKVGNDYIYWQYKFMDTYEPLDVLLCQYMGLLNGSEGLKIAQNDQICDFWNFKSISTSLNLILNTFSGTTNLQRLLGEYESLNALLCQYMGLLSGSEGLKVCSKLPNIRLFGQLRAFPLQNCFEYIFFVTNLWRLFREYEPLDVLIFQYVGF